MYNKELRDKLESIVKTNEIENITNPNKYRQRIIELRNVYNHSIVLEKEVGHGQYFCYMYALNLYPKSIKAYKHGDPFPDKQFIKYCLEKEHLKEKRPENRENGDIIIYYDNNDSKHAGKVHSGRIISKWGDLDLWNHAIWEIPANYGKRKTFYKEAEKRDVLNWYSKYSGVPLNQLNSYYNKP